MVNNFTNINKTNNHLSPSVTEQKETMTYDVGNPGPGLRQATQVAELNRLMRSQSAYSWWIFASTAIRQTIIKPCMVSLPSKKKNILSQKWRFWVGLWCLTPLSTISQLNGGGQFYWWKNRRKPPTCRQSLIKCSHSVVSSTPRHEWGSNSQL